MTAVWATVGGLAVATVAIKAAGPVLLGGRDLPPLVIRLIALLPAALLAALVLTETFTAEGGEGLAFDARAAGLAAATVALLLRASLLVVLVVAPVAAAGARAIG